MGVKWIVWRWFNLKFVSNPFGHTHINTSAENYKYVSNTQSFSLYNINLAAKSYVCYASVKRATRTARIRSAAQKLTKLLLIELCHLVHIVAIYR